MTEYACEYVYGFTIERVSDCSLAQNLNIYRPIIYGNTARVMTPEEKATAPPDHTHKWTVAVRSAASAPGSDIVGGADDLSYFIRRVTFKLHDTYVNPTRSAYAIHPSRIIAYPSSIPGVEKPPFELTETGCARYPTSLLTRRTDQFVAGANLRSSSASPLSPKRAKRPCSYTTTSSYIPGPRLASPRYLPSRSLARTGRSTPGSTTRSFSTTPSRTSSVPLPPTHLRRCQRSPGDPSPST